MPERILLVVKDANNADPVTILFVVDGMTFILIPEISGAKVADIPADAIEFRYEGKYIQQARNVFFSLFFAEILMRVGINAEIVGFRLR